MSKLQEKLQPSKDNIEHVKKLNLLTFSIFVGYFCPPGSGYGTDPGTPLNPDPQHYFIFALLEGNS
jgi:hypothetical protein